jgi:FAD dependent oxidoreductase
VDVVIIGGGIQGLVALDALAAKGYSCALVTDGDLGSGQTLHSHGYLNTGFGMNGPELPVAAAEIVQPYLEARGVELRGEWALIPPPGMPIFEGLPHAQLPAGFLLPPGLEAKRLPDRNIPKHDVVDALSRGHRGRILRGHATPVMSGKRVEAVSVPTADGEVVLSTSAVVIAAGCGSKRLLEGLVGRTPQTEQIKHRRVNMICVRAPRGSLPTTSIFAMPLGLMLAAHDQPDDVTWYVTPIEMGAPAYDDVPADAAAGIDSEMVVRATQTLLGLYPRLPEVAGLQMGCYAGYRQDIGDMPANRLCELVAGTDNVVAALPSGLVGAWVNASALRGIVAALVAPSSRHEAVPGAGVDVRAGSAVEDRPDFTWMGWDGWLERYPELVVQPANPAS